MKANFAFIILTEHIGGAEKRFLHLFRYLISKYPENFCFIVTWALYDKVLEIFPDYPVKNVFPIGKKNLLTNESHNKSNETFTYTPNHPGLLRQVYRFFKNYIYQKKFYKQIKKVKQEKNIKSFLGIYNGIIPLYFLIKKKKDAGIIFCDMDSWFDDVLPKERKYWYRKYNSFNYALENSDYIDFLSPFILEGIKKRGIKVRDESVSITPCSFTDYSKCRIGNKSTFQVAFAGRLVKDKNPDKFLDAAIILSQKYDDMIFHIMGDGFMNKFIQEKLQSINNSNIKFHKFHGRPIDIFSDTSVFVSIQTTNNYPSQSVLEAMACGNAIIATDVGDTRMFVNENNGILIKLDVIELVGAIEKLYKNKELCERLGDFAYKYVRESHNIQKVADYYINLFQKSSSKYIN